MASITRILLALFFAFALVAAAGSWFYMPHGFPVDHPRFFSNTALPVMVGVLSLFGLIAAIANQERMLKLLAVFFGGSAVATGIVSVFLFPVSLISVWIVGPVILALGGIVVACLTTLTLREKRTPLWILGAVMVPALILGAFLPFSQKGTEPATRPAGESIDQKNGAGETDSVDAVRLADNVVVNPSTASLYTARENTQMHVLPVLTFLSRSPDGFWSLFSPQAERFGTRTLSGLRQKDSEVELTYEDDGLSKLQIEYSPTDDAIEIDARSQFEKPVYSHLNFYTQLMVRHQDVSRPTSRRLFLSFSPCPAPIEVKEMDYPVGRPMRLAYLDGTNTFRVVEATTGEKGPFRELASGRMEQDDPLVITIQDEEKELYRITLKDWARQASKQLSPTAGWGLPENAIGFHFGGSPADKKKRDWALIDITLANTSVGRGFDTVGHAPGTYVNNMKIEPLD